MLRRSPGAEVWPPLGTVVTAAAPGPTLPVSELPLTRRSLQTILFCPSARTHSLHTHAKPYKAPCQLQLFPVCLLGNSTLHPPGPALGSGLQASPIKTKQNKQNKNKSRRVSAPHTSHNFLSLQRLLMILPACFHCFVKIINLACD